MKGANGDKQRLQHILVAIIEIENYISGSGFESFLANSMMRFASVKQIEIIGEASNFISEETQRKFSEIEWRRIKGMRNVLVHEYFGINYHIIWEVIKNDLPELKIKIQAVIESFE